MTVTVIVTSDGYLAEVSTDETYGATVTIKENLSFLSHMTDELCAILVIIL
jgi:hypothetical protein